MKSLSLEERIQKIEGRNSRVEKDKAWETSWTRRLSVILLTYITISIFLWIINVPNPFINAVVPVLGFMLSTLSLPLIRQVWEKYK